MRAAFCLLLLAATSVATAEPPPLVVHEWGTFTSLQDDDGKELPGINIDDEPVPGFVHNLAPYLLNSPVLGSEYWAARQKGAPRQHPMVTMRLETPVIYFYPGGSDAPRQVDVRVRFRGGWLTEFYPYAKSEMPGLKDDGFRFGPLTPDTVGELTWRDVRLGTNKPGPETDAHVWLAPRAVKAASVSVRNTAQEEKPFMEHERYLFYRGVANQRAPLSVMTDHTKDELTIRANFDDALCKSEVEIAAAWLVDIHTDGQTAFRKLPRIVVNSDLNRIVTTTRRSFSQGDYATENLSALKAEMHRALVADGLYEDEATAMLATWERAYFQTPGLRLFFTVPRVWTDHYLALSISGAPEMKRVMMGRIELITDWQRNLLKEVAVGPADARWIQKIAESPAKQQFLAGRSNFGDLGVQIPANYQAYLNLGRFRNALLVAAQKRSSDKGLTAFAQAYGIRPYDWKERGGD